MENVKQLICSCEQYLGNINKDTKEVDTEYKVIHVDNETVDFFICPSCGKTNILEK